MVQPKGKNRPSQVGAIENTRFSCWHSAVTEKCVSICGKDSFCLNRCAFRCTRIRFLRCYLYSWQSCSLRLIWGVLCFYTSTSVRARRANHTQHADSFFLSPLFSFSFLSFFLYLFISLFVWFLTFFFLSFFIVCFSFFLTFFTVSLCHFFFSSNFLLYVSLLKLHFSTHKHLKNARVKAMWKL